MKYLAYNPVTSKPFKMASKTYTITPNLTEESDGLRRIAVPTPDPFPHRNNSKTDGIVEIERLKNITLTMHLSDLDEKYKAFMAANDIANKDEMISIFRSIAKIGPKKDVSVKSHLNLKLPYDVCLSDILNNEFEAWLKKRTKTLNSSTNIGKEFIKFSKQILYYKCILNAVSKFESCDNNLKLLTESFDGGVMQFLQTVQIYYMQQIYELFNNMDALLDIKKAHEIFSIMYYISLLDFHANKNLIWDTSFEIENLDISFIILEKLYGKIELQMEGHILGTNKLDIYGVQNKLLKDICLSFYKIPAFYEMLKFTRFEIINCLSTRINFKIDLKDEHIIDSLNEYILEQLLSGRPDAVVGLEFLLKRVAIIFGFTSVTKLLTCNEKYTHICWNMCYSLLKSKTDNLENVKNLYDRYKYLLSPHDKALDAAFFRLLQEYFEENLINLYEPHISASLVKLATYIKANSETAPGLQLTNFLKIKHSFERADDLLCDLAKSELVVKAMKLEESDEHFVKSNRKVRIPGNILSKMKEMLQPLIDEGKNIRLNKNFHMVELNLNMGDKTIEIVCSPFVYIILSAFENSDSRDFEKLREYSGMETNQFKSNLQKIRNEKILYVKNGRVKLNQDITNLPDKIIMLNTRY